MNAHQFEQYARAMRILNERLAAKAAGRFAYAMPPRQYAVTEKLALVAGEVYAPVDPGSVAIVHNVFYKE